MAHIVAKKSYVLIDTPKTCSDCSLMALTEDFERIQCPVLGKSFSLEEASECRDENCPLKTIEFDIKMEC